ncbi:MAG: hypothetical protein ACLUUJ_08100, partial [Acutalibacteraceae bacterium]
MFGIIPQLLLNKNRVFRKNFGLFVIKYAGLGLQGRAKWEKWAFPLPFPSHTQKKPLWRFSPPKGLLLHTIRFLPG